MELTKVYEDYAPSLLTIKFWTPEYRRGRTSLFDEDRPKIPNKVNTSEMFKKIQDTIIAYLDTIVVY